MENCYQLAIDNWEYHYKISIDSNNDTIMRATCCLMWETYDCQLFLAQNFCNKSEYEEFYDLWISATNYWTNNEVFCNNEFPFGTPKCYFPIWIIAVLITVCLVILLVQVIVMFHHYRRRIYL